MRLTDGHSAPSIVSSDDVVPAQEAYTPKASSLWDSWTLSNLVDERHGAG